MALSTQQAPVSHLNAFMAEAAERGYHVGEHPAYGGVHPVHTKGSWHYDGLAADINWTGTGERAKLLELIPLAEAYGLGLIFARDGIVGAAVNHQGHLHVDVGSWSNYGKGNVRAKTATRKPPPASSSSGKTRKPKRIALLKRGKKTGRIKLWQRILRACGHTQVKADGVFGPITERATRDWQHQRGLTADGVVGPRTWARALLSDADGRLRRGDTGPHVELLQLIVGAARDGVYGPGTQEAVRRVQRWLGVATDTIIGPGTTGALVRHWT